MEARHEWWAVMLREMASGVSEDVTRDAAQAALDYIEELEGQQSVEEFMDGLGATPVLTSMDIEQLLDDYEKAGDAPRVCAALSAWLIAAEHCEDDKQPHPPRAA